MFAKRLLHKAVNHHHHSQNMQQGSLTSADLDLRVAVHYGIPSTSSILAFDPIQRLLAIGTLDGRIKVIGGGGIEGLLISPKQLPYKYIEFLQNQGYLVSILNDNSIQVWNLEGRCLVCSLEWESNITAFSVIHGSNLMYVGDEYAVLAVVKYDIEEEKLLQLPYHISADLLSEAAEFPFPTDQPIVGLLPQPGSSGNRVLIAYQNGLLILWDVSEAQIVFLGGGKDLQLKDGVVKPTDEVNIDSPENTIEHELGEKEISALCWASSNGSILAVGYVDGDILFWNTSSAASIKGQQVSSSSNNVVKLRLSSAERRLPVIVLQWCTLNKSHNDCDGQLFIYGGDEIGSDEVLTVLTLDWSSGMGNLRCVGRTDLTLTGSFADMILLTNSATIAGNHRADAFVLTNPGQLHFYDETSLSSLISQQEKKPCVSALEFPVIIPTTNPTMTAAKLIRTATGENSLKDLSEIFSAMNLGSLPTSVDGTKWPLTGGVPSQLSLSKNSGIERLYLAGYSDGSVRIWNATYPLLSFVCVLEGEVQGIKVAGLNSPVSRMDFCIFTLNLAVGSESGLVRIYNLKGCSDGIKFLFVTETKCEAHSLSQVKGPQCRAVFSLTNSRVQALQFVKHGGKLAVGFECGHVAMLDTSSLSILFFIKDASFSSSPVISMTWKEITNPQGLLKSTKLSETKSPVHPAEEVLFILTKDANIHLICGNTGNVIIPRPWQLKKEAIAISMYVIDGRISASKVSDTNPPEETSKDNSTKNESMAGSSPIPINSLDVDQDNNSENAYSEERLLNSLILLCCVDSVRLYSTKSVIQGNNEPIRKVKHARPCIWAATLKNVEKTWGLTLLFQTGEIEIRSIPDLELVKESSLMSILRWNCKANMDKTMSFGSDQSVVGGCRSICDKHYIGRYSDSCDIGTNCCQTSIPPYLRVVTASIMVEGPSNMTGRNDSRMPDCSDYAFLVDKDWFEAASNYSAIRHMLHVPVALEWSVINGAASSVAFRGNEKCHIGTSLAFNQSVLSCSCPQGFDGNPYLLQPCQDIDECKDGTKRCWPGSKCVNLPGSFKCKDNKDTIKLALAGLGSSLGLLLLLIGAWWVHKLVKKRKNIRRKEMAFKRNGGLLLKRQLSSGEVNLEKIKLFKSKELEKSTDNFHVDRILGKGGQGTVYKGMLTDGRIVAVKRSTKVDEARLSQFINEVVILSQINHRNVVKLLGCCLETEVPLLVYEFIPNGSLSQYIHEQNEDFPLTWELRIRIATEIAGALSYLHGAASIPIFHRDIKSTNILLDEKYRAKVADFGTSRSVAIDQTHLTTLVYGTFGYLDPEYFQSSQFTDKSDVYSFGVVLVELLSGQKPISSTRSQEEGRSLATHFIILMQDDRLFEIVDAQVLKEASREDILVVANLARRCLNLNGRNRPTMREVTAELEGIQMSQNTNNDDEEQNHEEVDIFRYDSIEQWDVASTSTGTVTGTRSGVAAGPPSSSSQGIALLSL